ncbi:hypothetical protein ACFYQA_22680 [Streptomyces sp. NPDC005774]|uniref:hypothetical protein n=1 Tax=Streptomyces sp. NPDC005774 TaxID=3364728 RepID=UPI00368D84D2
MFCHLCGDVATHYYRTTSGQNSGRCGYHAEQFGYPQYLVEIAPKRPAMRTPAYLIQFADGKGDIDPISDIWPFDQDQAAWWVDNVTGCGEREADLMIADAIYDAYRPQYLEAQYVTAEVTRVTLLPVLDDCSAW